MRTRPGIPLSKTDIGADGGTRGRNNTGNTSNDSDWGGNNAMIMTRMTMTMHMGVENSSWNWSVCRLKD